jgi:hypothetical protein
MLYYIYVILYLCYIIFMSQSIKPGPTTNSKMTVAKRDEAVGNVRCREREEEKY